MSWPRFLFLVGIAYVLINAIFAIAYVACGEHSITGFADKPMMGRFLVGFFFSVHTLATIGYGNIVPISYAANLLVTVESLVGLLGCDVEFLVLLNGFDETFSQNVHARSSYRADEVVWGARFRSTFNPPNPDGTLSVDIRKLDEFDRVPLPAVTPVT